MHACRTEMLIATWPVQNDALCSKFSMGTDSCKSIFVSPWALHSLLCKLALAGKVISKYQGLIYVWNKPKSSYNTYFQKCKPKSRFLRFASTKMLSWLVNLVRKSFSNTQLMCKFHVTRVLDVVIDFDCVWYILKSVTSIIFPLFYSLRVYLILKIMASVVSCD